MENRSPILPEQKAVVLQIGSVVVQLFWIVSVENDLCKSVTKELQLAERFFGHAVVFNSLENEPMAVTKQFTQL